MVEEDIWHDVAFVALNEDEDDVVGIRMEMMLFDVHLEDEDCKISAKDMIFLLVLFLL